MFWVSEVPWRIAFLASKSIVSLPKIPECGNPDERYIDVGVESGFKFFFNLRDNIVIASEDNWRGENLECLEHFWSLRR